MMPLMPHSDTVYLVVSLDVEEEGLFSGNYATRNPSVTNIVHLTRMTPLLKKGIRPTLFCAYSVLDDKPSRAVLKTLQDRVEIGAHLHHWNTPPLDAAPRDKKAGHTQYVSAADVPLELFAAKIQRLFQICTDTQGAPPTSFRMGRWDMHRKHWPALAQAGVLCDASIRPLHATSNGPNHFNAPATPYWVPVNAARIFETPLTVTPLIHNLPRLLTLLPRRIAKIAQTGLYAWGALTLLPVYHSLQLMQAVTRIFLSRGGNVLSLTWHSSEMMPNGAPHLPSEASVARLMDKISTYIDWLRAHVALQCLSMDELRQKLGDSAPTPRPVAGDTPQNDWTYA
ncbi:MAG: glycosyl transferase family 1 [Desulfovibrio sp.]|jgi:hypothetical protein|nr:glycosyl transferase family 1 [Desulfovibrio sp.]